MMKDEEKVTLRPEGSEALLYAIAVYVGWKTKLPDTLWHVLSRE